MSDFAARRMMMVDTQIRPSDVTKFPIIEAMLAVPRELYVPAALREAAYVGGNLDLGGERVVLEPRSFAKILDALELEPTDLVLDVGCALGYSAAVIARIAGTVVALEQEPDLAAHAQRTLADEGVDNAVVVSGVLAQGAPQHGPYDAIIIEGGVEEIGQELLDQLKDGGRIAAIFMRGGLGVVRIGQRSGASFAWRFSFNGAAPVVPGFAKAPAFAL